jgi:hypothetical protein
VVLQIDTSAPLLRPSQLTALVRAVHGADPHDEHRWIEWKSTLDLTVTPGQAHLVKHILGLANRQPAAAAQRAGGYGYLLVGVESGAINGVATVDPETLIGKIRVYVGDAVQWTPEYVEVDGKQVLVVIVDPPQPGDPIHSLRKQLDKFPAGTIFVRHTGRTDPATPGDLDMLQARLLERTPSLQMAVTAVPPTIEEMPDIIAAMDQWVQQRRRLLLAVRHQPSRRSAVPEDIVFPLRGALDALTSKVQPDTRTEEQYAEQIERFLEKARNALVDRALWELFRHAPALLRLQVSNLTDLGYTGVRLAVHVPGQVKGYPKELVDAVDGDRPDIPRPPKPLGTPTVTNNSLFAGLANQYAGITMPQIPNLSRYVGPGPGYTVRDTGSVTIDYREFEVRPNETVTLDPVPLLVHEDPGATLTAKWSATAAQVRGRLTGEFALTVNASTLDLVNIDQDHDTDE